MASDPYYWIKAVHLIGVIAWMAGLMIYPRLLVYRLEAAEPDAQARMNKAAESARKIILTPMIIVVWVFGLALLGQRWAAFSPYAWIWVKLAGVVGLSGIHGYLVAMGRRIVAGERPIEPKKLRMLNELPFLIMIVIVVMVAVKPF